MLKENIQLESFTKTSVDNGYSCSKREDQKIKVPDSKHKRTLYKIIAAFQTYLFTVRPVWLTR